MRSNLELGDIFASIGVRELQPNASEAFAIFADCHRYVYQVYPVMHFSVSGPSSYSKYSLSLIPKGMT